MSFIKFDPAENFYFHHGMSKRVSETGTSWPHYHSLYEIYFMLEGNCTYIIDNKLYAAGCDPRTSWESEYNRKDTYSKDILICHTHSLFYLILRNSDSCITVDVGNKLIEQAVAYIRENFASDITLSALAKKFSVSPEHFSRMFKKETGLGFSKYLNSLRLQYAEHLLKNSESQNITQVAEICGFEDSNYFSKKFKEVYGTSPKNVQKHSKG